MKINNLPPGLSGTNGPPAVEAAGKVGGASSSSAATAAGYGAGWDSTSLSQAASLASQLSTGPEVRMEKVTGIQQAMQAGSYQVSAGDVADSVMASMLQR
jgi:negative regulator of flagellin synthesis FlgM